MSAVSFSVASRSRCRACILSCAAALWASVAGPNCIRFFPPPAEGGSDGGAAIYNNTTDPTNKGATYIGAQACGACHPTIADAHRVHGHAHILTRAQGEPPGFPEVGLRAGVPNPPQGFDWADISYVIGGYTRKAEFIDKDGYILTTGMTSFAVQWNLSFPPSGTSPGFVDYEPDAAARMAYAYSCFACHTTGPLPLDENSPQFQENRPGFAGTWREAGVQCEACHGPGSNHIPDPGARGIFVDSAASACGKCHSRGDDPAVILAMGGYIQNYQQWPELRASGGHSSFSCTVCHNPHRSANYDLDNAIRNQCSNCHTKRSRTNNLNDSLMRCDRIVPFPVELRGG